MLRCWPLPYGGSHAVGADVVEASHDRQLPRGVGLRGPVSGEGATLQRLRWAQVSSVVGGGAPVMCGVAAPCVRRGREQHEAGDGRLSVFEVAVEQVDGEAAAGVVGPCVAV